MTTRRQEGFERDNFSPETSFWFAAHLHTHLLHFHITVCIWI